MSKFYKHKGKLLPRVTEITGQLDKSTPLTYWAANCACDYIIDNLKHFYRRTESFINEDDLYPVIEKARKEFKNVSNKALDIGSAVHKIIEMHLKTGEVPEYPSEEVRNAFEAFLKWEEEYKIEPIKTEHTIYSERYAGTLDLICWLTKPDTEERLKYVVDFKSSKGFYVDMNYQVAAYREACSEDIDGSGILRLDKVTGKPYWKDISDTHGNDILVFLSLTDLWWKRHPKHK